MTGTDDTSKNKSASGAAGAGGSGDGDDTNPWAQLTASQMEMMERLSRTAMDAATSSSSLMTSAAKATTGEAVDPDPFHLAPDAAEVWGRLASDPAAFANAQMKLWSGYMNLWQTAAQRMAGASAAAPAASPESGDKRWRAEDWSENPYFDLIKQSYLFTAQWLQETIESADGVDPETRRKVAFFTRQMSDAFSPTNFALTNPAVLRETIAQNGENLMRGMKNLADDLERGKGRLAISQTDYEQFQVGIDVASSDGAVVFRNDIIELIHYAPRTEQTYARPLLIFPPWINKFYILDLRPENSMIQWLTGQGYPVFLVSWVNPDTSHATKTFEDYMKEGIFAAVDAVKHQTGADQVNTVGYCIGGTLLASTLAYMAKKNIATISSATFFAAQTDFSEAGELMLFTSDEWMAEIAKRMDAHGGVLDGQTMADTFNMLRSNDLIWSFVINNYLLGKAPKPFDLLFWNSDQTRLAKALHLFYLDQFYRKNALSQGTLVLDGEQLSLGDVDTPCYFQASREDHIAPFRSIYNGVVKLGGPVRFTLAGSGHIAGVINHPDAKKYQHWTNDDANLPPTVDAWLAGATERPGSWWPDWDVWLQRHSGPKQKALHPDDGPLGVIEPAPGSNVKVKS